MEEYQDEVFWVDIDLGIKEGLVFYQARSNAMILQGTLPAHCIVKLKGLKLERSCMKDNICLLDHTPKISLKHDLNWTKGNDQGL